MLELPYEWRWSALRLFDRLGLLSQHSITKELCQIPSHGCKVELKASSKEYLITGSTVKKDKQGARSVQAHYLSIALRRGLGPQHDFSGMRLDE